MKPLIKYWSGYKYILAEDYSIQTPILLPSHVNHDFLSMTMYGLLTINEGYAWDGPSGPTIDTPSAMRGSLVHDALYQMMREELLSLHYRPVADQMLYKLCIEDGMWKWRAWLWRREVGKFAGFAAMPENERRVITAP